MHKVKKEPSFGLFILYNILGMYKKNFEFEQLKSVLYLKDANGNPNFSFGRDNRVYRSLIRLFEAFWIFARKELYLVGGCCRDLLLGREPKDYDLCTNATPEEVKEIIEGIRLKSFDSGIKHGTITVIDDFYQMSYEITTYRVDGKYTDGRHPDTVTFTPSLEEDLKRRDFTINSFAYDLLRQELIMLDESYLQDLEFGIIRTVGKAEERFNEDALRMLRALRFSAQLNFAISDETYEAIKKLHNKLSYISKERIRDELTKIIMSDNPQALELFALSGLETAAFDGNEFLKACLSCEHENPWHYTDVFHHTMDVIKRVPKVFELRWAALLHDLGKPRVKVLKEGTTDHYRYVGHQDESVLIAEELMTMLKFSNEQMDLILKYVKYHDIELLECKNSRFKRIVADIGINHFLDFMKLKLADAFAHKLSKDTKYAIYYPDKIYERYAKVVSEHQALTVRDLDINGFDLMELGLKGKQVGDCLNYLIEEVLEDSRLNTHSALIKLAEDFVENLKK